MCGGGGVSAIHEGGVSFGKRGGGEEMGLGVHMGVCIHVF